MSRGYNFGWRRKSEDLKKPFLHPARGPISEQIKDCVLGWFSRSRFYRPSVALSLRDMLKRALRSKGIADSDVA